MVPPEDFGAGKLVPKTNDEIAEEKRLREQQAPDAGELASAAIQQFQTGPRIADLLTGDELEPDLSFQPTQELVSKIAGDLPDHHVRRLANARSEEEMRSMARQSRKEMERLRTLSEGGWEGTSAGVAAALLDPAAIGVSLLTGGTATPLVWGRKVSTMRRMGRMFAVEGATEGTLEGVSVQARANQGFGDALVAGLAGGALGSLAGLARGKETTASALARAGEAERAQKAPTRARQSAQPSSVTGEEAQAFANTAKKAAREAQEREFERGIIETTADIDKPSARENIEAIKASVRDRAEAHRQSRRLASREQELRNETPEGRIIREEGIEENPRPSATRDSLDDLKAASRNAQEQRAVDGLTPLRKGGIGRKEAQKVKSRIDERFKQAERDRDFEIADTQRQREELNAKVSQLNEFIGEKSKELQDIQSGRARRAAAGEDISLKAGSEPDVNPTVGDSGKEADAAEPDAPSRDAGAAQVEGAAQEESPLGDVGLPDEANQESETAFNSVAAMRIDMVGQLQRSKSKRAAWLGRIMGADPVGNKKGQLTEFAVAEEQDRIWMGVMANAEQTVDNAFKRYAQKHGISAFRQYGASPERTEFGKQATRYIRSGDASAFEDEVVEAGQAISEAHAKMARKAREANLAGFENINEQMKYIHRAWNPNKIAALNADEEVGADGVRAFLKKAIIRGHTDSEGFTDLPDQVAESMADAVFKRFNAKGHGMDVDFNRGLSSKDLDEVKRTLDASGLEDARKNDILEYLRGQEEASDAGQVKFAKARINMDESTELTLSNGRTLRMGDLTEEDGSFLLQKYVRTMSGHVAFAKKFQQIKMANEARDVIPGQAPSRLSGGEVLNIKDRLFEVSRDLDVEAGDDIAGELDQAARNGAGESVRPVGIKTEQQYQKFRDAVTEEGGATDSELKKLDAMFNMIVGRPPEEAWESVTSDVARFIRDWNFMRMMGQTGIAQLNELANIAGQAGVRSMVKALPEVGNVWRGAKSGKLETPVLKEMADFDTFFGAERLVMKPQYRLEDYGVEQAGVFGAKAKGFVDNAKRFTSDVSGMSAVTIASQRVGAVAAAQRFLRMARGEVGMPKERLARLGLDEDRLNRVMEQIHTHAGKQAKPDGGEADVLNLKNWDDAQAREHFLNAMNR